MSNKTLHTTSNIPKMKNEYMWLAVVNTTTKFKTQENVDNSTRSTKSGRESTKKGQQSTKMGQESTKAERESTKTRRKPIKGPPLYPSTTDRYGQKLSANDRAAYGLAEGPRIPMELPDNENYDDHVSKHYNLIDANTIFDDGNLTYRKSGDDYPPDRSESVQETTVKAFAMKLRHSKSLLLSALIIFVLFKVF